MSVTNQFRGKLYIVAAEYVLRLEEISERQKFQEKSGTGIDSATRYIGSIRKALYQSIGAYQALKAG